MSGDDFERLLECVADDADVDWEQVRAAAEPAATPKLAQLELLHRIARLHRHPDAADDADDVDEPEVQDRQDGPVPAFKWRHLEVRRRLGSGSFGDVFLAWDTRLHREVALKLLRTGIGDHTAPSILAEARLLAKVRHPNVMAVHGAAYDRETPGIWMEYVEGETLDVMLARSGPFSGEEAALVGITLCRALAAVHRAGLLHRDVKAQNVLRERGGRLVLTDFGTGRSVGDAAGGPELAGTPLYLAPELFAGRTATVQSDLYSLGTLLFLLVTGEFPCAGSSVEEIRQAHATGRRRSLQDARPELKEAIAQVIERALCPAPQDRFASASDMARALTVALGVTASAAAGTRGRSPRRWPMLVALGCAAALLVGWMADRSTASGGMDVRRITFRQGRVLSARYAPDARTIVYGAQWGTEPRAVFSAGFDSLESRSHGLQDASVLAISSRGELAVLLKPRFLRGYQEAGTLATVAFGGTAPRELRADVQEADWAPDGSALALVHEAGGRARVEYPAGRELYTTTGWISGLRVSPDGTHVAFIDHPTPADDSGHVVVVDREGRRVTDTPRWVSIQGLAWAPDGREVWFSATEEGNRRAIHAVDRVRRTRMVRSLLANVRLHDIAPDGRVLITEEHTRVGILARTPADAAERELSWMDWSIARDLSADGSLLLLNESGEGGGAEYGVYLRASDGAPATRLGDGSGLSLSPDKRWVLASHPSRGLLLLPTGAGEARRLPAGPRRYQQWGDWFPDNRRVLFAGVDDNGMSRVYVQELAAGGPHAVTPAGVYLTSSDALAPDGQRIAAVGPDHVPTVYHLDRTAAERVPGAAPGEVPIHWSADGRALFTWMRGQAPARISQVDVTTGQRTPWRTLMPADPTGVHEILRIVLSDDARTYAYSYTREISTLHQVTGLR